MEILAATFVVVFTLIGGGYWLFVVRPESSARERVVKRAGPKKQVVASELVLVKLDEKLSDVPFIHWLLTRLTKVSRPLKQMVDSSGLKLTVGSLLLLCGIAGLGTYLVVYFVNGLVGLAALLGLVGFFVPLFVVNYKSTKRMQKFEEQFPEAIDLIARSLRAGHAFPSGLNMAAEELEEPGATEFRTLYEQQNYGMSMEHAMRDFARRVPLLDARFFATAVLTQREAGGNLSEVLDNLSTVIRERFRVKRQVRVHTAHARITGWTLVAFPPFLATCFYAVAPENMKLLVTDPLGVKMVIGAVFLQLLGTLIIRKMVDIDY